MLSYLKSVDFNDLINTYDNPQCNEKLEMSGMRLWYIQSASIHATENKKGQIFITGELFSNWNCLVFFSFHN